MTQITLIREADIGLQLFVPMTRRTDFLFNEIDDSGGFFRHMLAARIHRIKWHFLIRAPIWQQLNQFPSSKLITKQVGRQIANPPP